MKSRSFMCGIVLFVLSILAVFLLVSSFHPMYSTQSSMEKWLVKYGDYTSPLIDLLSKVPYNNCGFDSTEEDVSKIKVLGEIPTLYIAYSDDDAERAAEYLLKNAQLIRAWKSNGYIYFPCWSSLDEESGVVYSLDGGKPQIPNCSAIDKYEGWYFYREN